METTKAKYIEIPANEIPYGVRFDVSARTQGQMIEVAYGGFLRSEHGVGDPYKRVTDRTDRSVTYYHMRRVMPPTTVSVHISIGVGVPSEYYTPAEQAAKGAIDHDVTLTISKAGQPDRIVEGGITLFRDEDGTQSTCGTPREGWCSSTLLIGVDALGEAAVRILDALSRGARADDTTIEIAVVRGQ